MSTPPAMGVGKPDTVGILGGGQLGCMLMDAALELGLDPWIYAEPGSPALTLFGNRAVGGSLDDEKGLREFFSRIEVVAFENEFLDCDRLGAAAAGQGVRFAPGLPTLRSLQDKLGQKKILTELGLPTAEYVEISADRLPEQLTAALARLGGQAVLKWSRQGYDGKGVLMLGAGDADGHRQAIEFCSRALDRGIPVYAEKRIAFRRELAILGCRSHDRKRPSVCYPLVISEQLGGICDRVQGPAVALGVDPRLAAQAADAASRLGDAVGLEGVFALELFETQAGTLLVNEIAPRVHNTGHYTQNACETSQFKNHWLGILGRPWGATQTPAAFAMLNLLGPAGVDLRLPARREKLPWPAPPSPIRLHWYAKTAVRPGRKVGHLNAVATSAGQLPELQEQLTRYRESWAQALHSLQERNPA